MEYSNGKLYYLILLLIYSIGVTVESIKVVGKTENNMEKVNFIILKKLHGEKVYGMMEKDWSGSNNILKYYIKYLIINY